MTPPDDISIKELKEKTSMTKLNDCRIGSHVPTDSGSGCDCGYFTRATKTYKPALELYYITESDGDAWFTHYNDFTNLQESDEVAFGKTPQEALQNFIDSRVKSNLS